MKNAASPKKVSEKWVSYWPKSEQPRERLMARGADALSDAELLAIFLRVGVKGANVVELSRQLLQQFGSLRGLFKAAPRDLKKVRGLGTAKIATLQAIAAMSQRLLEEQIQRHDFIECSDDVRRLLAEKFRDLDQEIFSVVFLDTKHRVIAIEELFHGTINTASVFPREVVKRGLELGAAAVVAVHNHPSGNPEPSGEDRRVTEDLKNACQLMEMTLLDHLVIGGNGYFSFADKKIL